MLIPAITRQRIGAKWTTFLAALLLLTPIAPVEAAQYRAKVYLDPSLSLGEQSEVSLESLEAQLDSLEDSYAKSTAARQLAEGYLARKEYAKAAAYYETVLKAGGLDPLLNNGILRQLAAVYLKVPDYQGTIDTLQRLDKLEPIDDPTLLLILAQAHHKLGNQVAVSRVLDQLLPRRQKLDSKQLKQMLALYFQAGNYPRSEQLLKVLIQRDPNDSDNWQLLVAVYLAQNKQRAALNQLQLAQSKGIALSDAQWQQLAALHAKIGNASKGARTLELAIEQGHLKGNAKQYRQLFEFWLRARENEKAKAALKVAAKLSGNLELYLKLAQLQMEQQQWQAMNDTLLQACQRTLPDHYVSRTNLLLGISRYKLDDNKGARQALINATLVGSNDKARQWLRFIDAAPASVAELRRISPPCQPKDPNVKVDSRAVKYAQQQAEEQQARAQAKVEPPSTKTVAKQTLYGANFNMTRSQMSSSLRTHAVKLGMAIVKGGGSIDGPLTMIFNSTGGQQQADGPAAFKLALPIRGRPAPKGKYRLAQSQPFYCAYVGYQGPATELESAWRQLYQSAVDAGMTPSDEQRIIARGSADGAGQLNVELQLGLLPAKD